MLDALKVWPCVYLFVYLSAHTWSKKKIERKFKKSVQ